MAPRGGGDPILQLDLTYKVQTEPGGIAQVVGMARDFAAGAPLVVVLGDNIFEFAQSDEHAQWAERPARARIFVKEVADPENFGVVVYDENVVSRIVEKAGVVHTTFGAAFLDAVVGLYCYPTDVFEVIAMLEPSSRGSPDHGRQPLLRRRRQVDAYAGRGLVGGRGQALAAPR